jgi:hypothetical protein
MKIIKQICIFLLFNVLLFSCKSDNIRFAEIRPPYKSLSPIVKKWLAMDTTPQLPLVEKDSLYDDYVFITFLYQNELPNKAISFEMFGIYEEYRFADMKLYPLLNTETYYRS